MIIYDLRNTVKKDDATDILTKKKVKSVKKSGKKKKTEIQRRMMKEKLERVFL